MTVTITRNTDPGNGPKETAALVRKINVAMREANKPLNTCGWKELNSARHGFKKQLDELVEIAASAQRDLTELETGLANEVQGAIDKIDLELDKRASTGSQDPRDLRSGRVVGDAQLGERKTGGLEFRDLDTGRMVRGFRLGESIAASYRDAWTRNSILTFGDFCAHVVSGRWPSKDHAEEARALGIGSVGIGGAMVPAPLAATWIDLARNQAAVLRAGAVVVPMDSATLALARLASGVTPAWKAENDAFSSSDPTFERVTLTAKTLGAIATMSAELAEDAPNISQVLETELTQSLAIELDRAALMGSGAGAQPTGIFTDANRSTYTLNGPIVNYDPVSRAVQTVRTSNLEPNAMIAHPRTYGDFDRLKDGQNQPLMPPKSFVDLKHFSSAQVPVNQDYGLSPANQTCAFVGKWDELLIGMRLNSVLIEVSRSATVGTDTAFSKYQVHVRAILRADVQLARPAGFCVIEEIEQTA